MGGVDHNPAENTGEGEREDHVIGPAAASPPGSQPLPMDRARPGRLSIVAAV